MRPTRPLSQPEFIAMIGTLFATIAFSIDSMLPALPAIAAELSPESPNLAQLMITSFVLGMGIGTFVVGPLSDAYGRRVVIFCGTLLYLSGAVLAYFAQTLETVLLARVLAGLGVAAPRIVAIAIVRDLYSGRAMAQVMSFAMTIFTVFPAIAPLIGSAIIAGFGWRAIFVSFIIFSVVSVGWLALRQPETLDPENRRKMSWPMIMAGLREIMSLRQMRLSILAQTLIMGLLFGAISSIQPIFDVTYGAAERFPWFFFAIAMVSMPAAPINGILVTRFGMRLLVRRSLTICAIAALIFVALSVTDALGSAEIWGFYVFGVILFATFAFTIGNLNSLALEPLGHVAGLASSVMAGLATVGGAALGAGIGQLFDGTPVPAVISVALLAILAALIMRRMPREAVEGGEPA